MIRLYRKFIHSFILILSLSACQAVMHEKGTILKPEDVNSIKIGVTNQQQVRDLLGSPTLVNLFRKERWIYIQDREYKNLQRTFTRVANRVEITFDQRGIVQEIDRNFQDKILDPNEVEKSNDTQSSWLAWFLDTENRDSPPSPLMNKETTQAQEDSRPLWKKLLFIRNEDKKFADQLPQPETSITPEKEGWWRNMWSSDPTTPHLPSDTSSVPQDE
ncbi:MAG: outer membrane protein assembly factor BamE [Magnetococcus sp. DMHC-6]